MLCKQLVRLFFSIKQENGSNPGSPMEAFSPGSVTARGKYPNSLFSYVFQCKTVVLESVESI